MIDSIKHIKYFFFYLLTFLLGTQVSFSKVEINQIEESSSYEYEVNVNSLEKSVQPNIGFLKEEYVLFESKKSVSRDNRAFALSECKELGSKADELLDITKVDKNLKINIYGEGEALPSFHDVATNAKYAEGRVVTSNLKDGSVSDFFIRDSPIDNVSEINRLAGQDAKITLMNPDKATLDKQIKALQESFGNQVSIEFQRYDVPKSYQINVDGHGKYTIKVETNIARVKVNRSVLGGGAFDINKIYATNYSETIREMERGVMRRTDGSLPITELYKGKMLEASEVTEDMLNALRQNAIDVFNKSIERQKWDNLIKQTNLMTNPRWRFRDQIPEVTEWLEKAVKGTPAEGKLFQGDIMPH